MSTTQIPRPMRPENPQPVDELVMDVCQMLARTGHGAVSTLVGTAFAARRGLRHPDEQVVALLAAIVALATGEDGTERIITAMADDSRRRFRSALEDAA